MVFFSIFVGLAAAALIGIAVAAEKRRRIERLIREIDRCPNANPGGRRAAPDRLDPEKYRRIRRAMYRRDAQRGDRFAELQWAQILWHQDEAYEEALIFYRRAAEAGDPEAMFALASAYFGGEHVAKDFAEATRWASKGLVAGDARCKHIFRLCSDLYAQR